MKNKILVIVESPAKSNTISKYLRDGYIVSSSMGHVRDLNPHILSIDVEKNFKPYYENLESKKHIISELKKISRKVESILLAPDPDREGEAIAYHLYEILKNINSRIYRITFNEITKQAVIKAVENPGEINMNRVNSQQMRRLLDRLAGYKISPVLQKKIGGRLSAGRVQSVALKLIVERDRQIEAFVPVEFWTISANLKGSVLPEFTAKLEKISGKKANIDSGDETDKIVKKLDNGNFVLSQIQKRLKKRKVLAPLITSTLQQEAYKKFKFPVKMTMKIAQELYEGIKLGGKDQTGLITYMRTDSYRISDGAAREAKSVIQNMYGKEYIPEKQNFFGSRKNAQDAHEAIRPTFPNKKPDELKNFLNKNQIRIYKLIWDRFIASQMREAEINETKFHILNGDCLFMARGETIKFPGFLKVLGINEKMILLPELKENEILKLLKLDPKQNFTKPPARYTEATLVKMLEEKGIGRPSTYASIIDTLGKRDYVYREDKKFVSSFLGKKVSDFLDTHFSDLMQYNFTANLEKELDSVSEGSLEWTEGIKKFYEKLSDDLKKINLKEKEEMKTGKSCPECNGELVRKYSARTSGWFVGCSNYPTCRHTEKIDLSGNERKKDEVIDRSCPDCGKPLVKRFSAKTGMYFIGCTGYPDCSFIESVKENLGNCPQCKKPLVRKFQKARKRSFIGCSGYPDCKYIQKKKSKTE